MNAHNSRDAVREFIARGYTPVPIAKGEKAPHLGGWQKLKVSPDQVDQLFSTDCNIGLLLGEPSGGLVDVDLDAMESLPLASHFLPKTGMIHGRQSKPNSHYWYVAIEAGRTSQFKDVDGATLVELRSTGGQTVVPPSIHPSGEQIKWSCYEEPTSLAYNSLLKCTHLLAAATILVRHYPAQGSRQDFAMALAGALIGNGWSTHEATAFIESVCRYAGDEEIESRIATIQRTHEKLLSGMPVTGTSKLCELIGDDVYKRVALWLGLKNASITPHKTKSTSLDPSKSQIDKVISLGQGLKLFHSPQKESFALIENSNYKEVWPLRSTGFRSWINKNYLEQFQQAPKKQSLVDAIEYFHLKAIHESEEQRIYLRTGENDGKLYIDLGTPKWDVLEIDEDGWRVTQSPIFFYRPNDYGQLPLPKEGGDICYFENLLNTSSEDDLRLMIAWLLAAMRPTGPFPVLILQGEAGSAKSTAARILRQIIDPCEVTLRSPPRNERDTMIAGKSNWINAWDNISGLNEHTSDIVCRIATGGGFATRALYENDSEVLFSIQRPVLMNGINDIALRQDLVDRAMVITLPVICDDMRRDERTLWNNFKASHPWLLGYIASVASFGLRKLPTTQLTSTPRMADFCKWASSFETELGWRKSGFMNAYLANRKEALQTSLESEPVSNAVISLMKHQNLWIGTATDLLASLSSHACPELIRTKRWPVDATRLSGHVRRQAAGLRSTGIDIHFSKKGDRLITLKVLSKPASISVQRPVAELSPPPIERNKDCNDESQTDTKTLDASDAAQKDAKLLSRSKSILDRLFPLKSNRIPEQHNHQHTGEHNSSTPTTTPNNTRRDTK